MPGNLPPLAARGINVVIGTTGWQAHEPAMRDVATEAGIGVVAAANFSLGMNVFQLVVEEAARRFAPHPDFGAWLHEAHHDRKKDAPSGTALALKAGMEHAGFPRAIDVSSTRVGFTPGTHTVGFDGPSETIELTHTVRDRAVFARGALVAARWVIGRRGWFGMRDVLVTSQAETTETGMSRPGGDAMREAWTGVGTALITPFTRGGEVDEAAVKRLARRQIEAGVHFLVPCGTTGETPTLSDREKRRVVELVVEEARGQVPVLAGAGGYDTKEVVHAAKEMQKAGASGLLSVTPYYNKPTPEGLFQHFSAIADATPLPIVLYNVPGRTGCNMDAPTVARLATISHVVGVKEASGNMQQMAEIVHAVPPDFVVLSGDDAMTLPLMAIGGRGIISVASNEIPAEMVQMVEAAERGDYHAARALHHRLLPLLLVNFVEPNPGPVKFAMAAMGLCEEVYRLPMVPPRQGAKDRILSALHEVVGTVRMS